MKSTDTKVKKSQFLKILIFTVHGCFVQRIMLCQDREQGHSIILSCCDEEVFGKLDGMLHFLQLGMNSPII